MTENTHNPTGDTAAHPAAFGAADARVPEPLAPQPAAAEHADPAAAGETPAADAPAPLSSAPVASGEPAAESASEPEYDSTPGTREELEAQHQTAEARGPIEEIAVSNEPPDLRWYILKVQSNREESIREGLQRRVHMAGLDRYFGDIIVPTEMVSEFKGGKKRVVKRKLYPGYLVVHMEINDDTWFLVRETPGIGDFTGSAGKPSPMSPQEVSKIIAKQEEKTDESPKLKISFNKGDRVKINEGTFENFEGEVDSIDEANGRVTVMINIFGRSTPVELEYWQVEAL